MLGILVAEADIPAAVEDSPAADEDSSAFGLGRPGAAEALMAAEEDTLAAANIRALAACTLARI